MYCSCGCGRRYLSGFRHDRCSCSCCRRSFSCGSGRSSCCCRCCTCRRSCCHHIYRSRDGLPSIYKHLLVVAIVAPILFLGGIKALILLLNFDLVVPLGLFQLELHGHRWTGEASSFCLPALHKIPPALFHSLQYLCSAEFNFDCNLRILRSFFNAVFSKLSMSYSKILHDDAASRWPCPVAQYSPSQDRGLQSADPAISLDRESLHLLHFLIRWELWQGSGLWPKKLATRGQDHRRRPSSPSSPSSPSPSRASRPGQRAPRAQQEQALPIVLSPRLIHC